VAPSGLTIRGPLAREDLPGLYGRVCAHLADQPAGDVACDVTGLAADAVAVEALSRLQLAARANAQRVVMSGASEPLRAVIELVGLAGVLVAAREPA
jgi:ABC-type transporter Mla MlaB component